MEPPLLVDSDVMIDYLRGLEQAVAFVKAHSRRITLSSITVAELYAGAKGEAELAALNDLTTVFRVLPVTVEIARTGGLLRRDFVKSHGVGLADAVIAATAQHHGAALCTLNVRHFPMIPNLKPAYSRE